MRQIIRAHLQTSNPLTETFQPLSTSISVLQRLPLRQRSYAAESSLPRVAQPSLWQSIIPKFLRTSNRAQPSEKAHRSKEWNPATFFIVMFLLIGSNAMQLLALRNEFTTYSRRADAKIGLLKEVIERVQKGEDVDVKGLLGTGNPENEKEWEQGRQLDIELPTLRHTNGHVLLVMKEVEEGDRLWQANARRRQKKAKRNDNENPEDKRASEKTSPFKEPEAKEQIPQSENLSPSTANARPRGFY